MLSIFSRFPLSKNFRNIGTQNWAVVVAQAVKRWHLVWAGRVRISEAPLVCILACFYFRCRQSILAWRQAFFSSISWDESGWLPSTFLFPYHQQCLWITNCEKLHLKMWSPNPKRGREWPVKNIGFQLTSKRSAKFECDSRASTTWYGSSKGDFFARTISSWTLSKLLQSDCLDKKTFFPPVLSCFLLPDYYTRSFPRDVAAASTAAVAAPNSIQRYILFWVENRVEQRQGLPSKN